MAGKTGNKTEKNLHQGHRERVREQFLKNGAATMEPHVLLEMLLFYAIPRGDTNPTAHRLLERFGSFSGVFDAPYEELLKVEGIGPSGALLLKMIPGIFRRYQEDRESDGMRVFSSEEALRLIRPKFLGRKTEAVVLLLMDSRGRVVYCDIVSEGSVNAAPIYAPVLVRLAATYSASTAILAHNHPSGHPIPTSGDISATRHVIWALDALGVHLYDHLIVTETDYLSMHSSGILEELREDHEMRKEQQLYPEGAVASDQEPNLR